MVGSDEDVDDLDSVLQLVGEVFDRRIALATEAVLSTQTALLLDDVQRCPGLVVSGPSSAGKTMLISFIKETEYDGRPLVYWSDDITPASFVSHDASLDEEQLSEVDLLPKIRHKTLVNPDMGGWFSGNFERTRDVMSKIARIMDGEGLMIDSGAQGTRGYEGDYRFALIGATTPLDNRSWDAMGHVGNRLVFHYLPRKTDPREIADDIFEGEQQTRKVERCRTAITELTSRVWQSNGGYGSVTWNSAAAGELRDGFAYLAHLISHCRAPKNGTREGEHRVLHTLRDIARGRALLCGRRQLQMEDIELCSRLALSTMHQERRGIVRAVVDPATPDQITTKEIIDHDATTSTRVTLRDRMQLLERLGLGEVVEVDNGLGTKQFLLKEEFQWPEYLDYPSFR